MDTKEMLSLLDSWENLEMVVHELGVRPELFAVLMDVAINSREEKSWRAAWIADKIHDKKPELLKPYINKIIEQLAIEKQTGKKRHFLKLVSINNVPEKHFGFLVDYCLKVLTAEEEPPAVRVHAMQLLYNISEVEPGLKNELLAVLEYQMEYHPSPGIISRGSKLAKKLHFQINSFSNEL